MATLRDLIQDGQVGLTVYYPDALESRLIGHLDHDIHEKTGLKAGYRQWFQHNLRSVERFYQDEGDEGAADEQNIPEDPADDPEDTPRTLDLSKVPVENLQVGHFVAKHFTSGPLLLTLWHGDNAVEKLLAHKGKTHPAEADTRAIRGRFWCENPVCNLVHSSDAPSEVKRELRAIRLAHLLDDEPQSGQLAAQHPLDLSYMPHSSVSIMLNLINRVSLTRSGAKLVDTTLPASGEARAIMQTFTPVLKEAANTLSDEHVIELVNAYFEGDLLSATQALKQLPVTDQEFFVIQCGVRGMDKWKPLLAL